MKISKEIIKLAPKVELHCHLDGSVSIECMKSIMKQQNAGEISEDQLSLQMRAPVPCGSLTEYLQPFSFVNKWLQTSDSLKAAAFDVVRQAAEENVVYIEVRFAPMLHCEQGLRPEQVVSAVLDGLRMAESEFNIKAALILCMMRGGSVQQNQKVMEIAERIYPSVVAVDIAGSESDYPLHQYKALFSQAAEAKIPFTIHAGENGPAENVKDAIEMGARRIGHGLAIESDPDIQQLCREKSVLLELCPASNLQTKAAQNLKSYPFEQFMKSGIAVSVNTDNRTVSNTSLTNEYMLLSEQCEITTELMEKLAISAVEHSFFSGDKRRLCEEIKESYGKL